MAKNSESDRVEATTPSPESEKSGKGRPTPSRKDAQAQRAQPLVGANARPATKVDKQQVADARLRAREGYAAGDDRYLPDRDKGPQRRYVRDFVDARTSLGEWMLPLMLAVVFMTFVANELVQLISIFTIWGYLAALIIDSIFLGRSLKKRLTTQFGADKIQPGFQWYAIMRSLQMRRLRLPKPQVRRGEYTR